MAAGFGGKTVAPLAACRMHGADTIAGRLNGWRTAGLALLVGSSPGQRAVTWSGAPDPTVSGLRCAPEPGAADRRSCCDGTTLQSRRSWQTSGLHFRVSTQRANKVPQYAVLRYSRTPTGQDTAGATRFIAGAVQGSQGRSPCRVERRPMPLKISHRKPDGPTDLPRCDVLAALAAGTHRHELQCRIALVEWVRDFPRVAVHTKTVPLEPMESSNR